MLWDLNSEMVGQFCRSWNTCVKLVHNVPRSTHTYLVENVLAAEFVSVKTELMSRYIKFHQQLIGSKSFEVKALANIVTQDVRSTTGRNIALVSRETRQCSRTLTPKQVKLLVVPPGVPVNHEWRATLLPRLLRDRRELEILLQSTDDISDMSDSLCST